MARGAGGNPAGRVARTRQVVVRAWPVAVGAWKRWDSLSPQEKERYRKMAREYAERGRKALEQRRGRGR
jgi:hypothetical protein